MTTTEIAPDVEVLSGAPPQDSDQVAELVLPTSAEEVKDFKLFRVDPDQLVLGPNARLFNPDDLDRDFVEDLGDRGNNVPIIARFDAHGQLVVRDGQLRTHGLRKVKRVAIENEEDTWKTALVLAQEHDITDERASEIERLVEQHGANFLRFAMTEADHLRTVQGLLDLGVEPDKVAKKLRLKSDDATRLVTVAQCAHAAELTQQGVLGLSAGAVLAEFMAEFEACGDAEAIEELTEVARTDPGQLARTAQRLRDARTERLAFEAAAAELTEQGVTVIERPDTLLGPLVRQLADLRPTRRTKPGSTLSVKRHTPCPGHAAYLTFSRTWQNRNGKVTVIHVCTDFQRHKHAERNAEAGKVLAVRPTYPLASGPKKGPMTAEEKKYRNRVIDNGKAWDLAEIRRLDALTLFAKRRSLSQTEDTWLEAMRATSDRYADAASKGHRLALKLLGWDTKFTGFGRDRKLAIQAEVLKTKPERARVISMVMVLAALEQGVSRRTTWEKPTDEDNAYFRKLPTLNLQIVEHGELTDWVPSEVEKLVLDPAAPVDPSLVAAVADELEIPAVESSDDDLADEDLGAEDDVLGEDADPIEEGPLDAHPALVTQIDTGAAVPGQDLEEGLAA